MADQTWFEQDFSNPYREADPYSEGSSWSDYPKSFGARSAGMVGDLGAVVRSIGESRDDPDSKAGQAAEYLGKLTQNLFNGLEDYTIDSLSETSKRDLQATFTDPNFWSLNALAMKSFNMAPDVVAAAVPSALFPGIGTAVGMAALQGGAFSAASVVDDMYQMTDALPDEELQKQAKLYRDLREQGLDEATARAQYNETFRGMRPLLTGAIGAITNVFGPAGQAARAVGGVGGSALAEAGEGVIKRAGKGALEGATSEAIQEGSQEYLTQEGAVEGQLQAEIDPFAVAEAAATGAVLGGVLGGGISAATGRKGPTDQTDLVNGALGTGLSDAPGTNSPTPPEMPAPQSASGATASPGVPTETTAVGETVGATVAQEMQARKNFKVGYDELTPEQKATLDEKLVVRSQPVATVVEGAGPDPAQSVALAAKQPVTPQGNVTPEVTAPPAVTPEVTPPPAPVSQVTPAPISEVPAAAPVEPVVDTAPVVEAPVAPPVAEPAPIAPVTVPPVEQAAPAPTGPRVLEDIKAKRQADQFAAEQARQVAQNIRTMETPEAAPKGRNRTVAEKETRAQMRDGALMLAEKYPPREEEAGLLSKRPQEKVSARKLLLDRARAISEEAKTMGLAVPKAFRDNTNEDGYNPETLLVMEARRLASKQNPEPADYERFMMRELDVRTGSIDQAIAERRAEGDAAMRQSADVGVDTLTDTDAPADASTPEAALIAKEEAAEEAGVRPKAKEERIPASIDKALGEALYTVPKEGRAAPKIEAIKKRKITKPPVTPKVTEVTTEGNPEPVKRITYGQIQITKNTVDGVADLNRMRKWADELSQEDFDYLRSKTGNSTYYGFPQLVGSASPSAENVNKLMDHWKGVLAERDKAPSKLAEIKARVERARQETNTDPTQRQAETGNYKKGRVSIHGNAIAIENPKGSIRSNKDPNGPKWSVKMPADYGYIEGTKGADGDPVDVYVGPDHEAAYVYVVDQVDPDTRAFDEHKVMMGFKNEQAALTAYDKAFSDGRGAERVGDLRKMTHTEFKEWVNSDPKDRSGLTEEEAREARSLMIEDDFENAVNAMVEQPLPMGLVRDPVTREVAQPVSTRKASEVMADLDLATLRGLPRVLAGNARSILSKIVGDVDVHFIRPDDMKRMSGWEGDLPPRGYHSFRGNVEAVFIRSDLMDNPDALRHTLLHEVTHAATIRRIVTDRRLESNIMDLMYYVQIALDNDADTRTANYALTSPREFVAEAFSNPDFQELLGRIPADGAVVDVFDLDAPVRSMWDALISAVRRILGLPKATHSLLEAAIRVTERSMAPRNVEEASGKAFLEDGSISALTDKLKETLRDFQQRRDLAPTQGNPQLMGLRTFDSIARAADRYFGKNNPVRKVANLIEGQRVAAAKEFDKAAPIIQKLHDLSHKYRGDVWTDFTTLVHDETMAGVFADKPLADQKHISKKGAKDSWARAQHPELARRFNALPADLKAARQEAMDYFRNKQNEIALKLIRNRIVTLFDTPDPEGLAQRIHDGSVTDADKALMGEAYDAIAAAGTLSKINGPYFPLMRRGNYVVKGRYKVTTPGNATKISDNEFEFKDKDAAADYAATQSGRPTIRTVYVDKTTGETTGTENGKTVRLTAEDMNAEPRYRVVVQDRHMEMFDTMKEASNRVAELRAHGFDVDDAVPRAFENYGIQADALSTQMRRLNTVLERRADARDMTPEQKHELLSTMNEVSMSMLGSTRIQSRSLPRQYVAGASKDLVRNTTDYAHASGNYIAKLDFRPQLDAALEEMADAVKQGGRDGFQAGRTAIQNEVLRRATTPNPIAENKGWNALSSRILSMSFIDKLMSPTYSIINATQPMMTTAPYLAGQYGAGKAYAAMSKAYSDVGSMAAIKRGLADTVSKFKPGNTLVPTDPVTLIRNRLTNKGEQALIDILVERGVIDTDSGLEVGRLVQESKGIVGKFDKGIGYLEGIARQMPKTVEAINRSVSAIAAYRLEMARSGDQARAIQFAQDTVNLTQFNYSASNTAPFMNHPVLRLALQFKKYGLSMYQLLGEQVAMAVRNENPGDRARALKSLSYTIGMHVLVAGAMGLPTEPIRLVVTAANGLGVIDWNWGDIETAQREAMADMFGKQFGEIVSRGLPRAAGIDLSSRMGIDTLMGPFGEPRSNEAQDWKAYVWDTVAGAPAGLVADWAKGINDLAQGDLVRAAERLIPVKALSDSIKAYRTYTEGSVSEKTGKQVMEPYSVGEAALRAFGFTPAREAEGFERSAAFYRGRDKLNDIRTQFQREWVEANGAARGRLWREIQKWNRGQPVDARLSLSELRGYQKRLQRDMKETKEGIRARRREQHILDRAERTYDF